MRSRIGWIVLLGLVASEAGAGSASVRLATFRADMTPPIGTGPCVGFMPRVEHIEHPLELRGVILQVGDQRLVVAALDYQGLCNSSDDEFRRRMAAAAGTTPDRVALQSLHQHTAPVLDADAVRILHGEESREFRQHVMFTDQMAGRAEEAIRAALQNLRPVTRVVASRGKVERVASNRRVPQPDRSLVVRGSATRDALLHEAPEGLIDPWLRTVTFFDVDEPLVQLHYYATHPQSFYGDARVTWDVPGMARQRLEQECGVFQIYFNGCGGNLAMGKYNDGSRAAREQLAGRLHDAMRRSARVAMVSETPDAFRDFDVEVETLGESEVAWETAALQFSVREYGPFSPAAVRQQLEPSQPASQRLKAAMFAAWSERLRAGHRVPVSRLKLGSIQLVHLPGEPFVEFQLFAQQQAGKDSFVCVAGYGECGVWYYGPDSIYQDRGGYEQTWSFTGPCQAQVEAILQKLVRTERQTP